MQKDYVTAAERLYFPLWWKLKVMFLEVIKKLRFDDKQRITK